MPLPPAWCSRSCPAGSHTLYPCPCLPSTVSCSREHTRCRRRPTASPGLTRPQGLRGRCGKHRLKNHWDAKYKCRSKKFYREKKAQFLSFFPWQGKTKRTDTYEKCEAQVSCESWTTQTTRNGAFPGQLGGFKHRLDRV